MMRASYASCVSRLSLQRRIGSSREIYVRSRRIEHRDATDKRTIYFIRGRFAVVAEADDRCPVAHAPFQMTEHAYARMRNTLR